MTKTKETKWVFLVDTPTQEETVDRVLIAIAELDDDERKTLISHYFEDGYERKSRSTTESTESRNDLRMTFIRYADQFIRGAFNHK